MAFPAPLWALKTTPSSAAREEQPKTPEWYSENEEIMEESVTGEGEAEAWNCDCKLEKRRSQEEQMVQSPARGWTGNSEEPETDVGEPDQKTTDGSEAEEVSA